MKMMMSTKKEFILTMLVTAQFSRGFLKNRDKNNTTCTRRSSINTLYSSLTTNGMSKEIDFSLVPNKDENKDVQLRVFCRPALKSY